MEKNKEEKKVSRRKFLLSGLIAALGGYLGYTNRKTISDWARWPYTHFFDDRPNIIMIAMDTLRADHLGCYGYDLSITPNMDSLAKESLLYWNTMSQSNWTLPAFASLFASLNPHNHVTGLTTDKVKNVHRTTLPRIFTTLADILSETGYHTMAVTGGGYVSKEAGMSKGFSEFYQIRRKIKYTPNDMPWEIKTSSDLIKRHYRTKKFFLFFHTYECHDPYLAPKDYIDLIDPDYDGSLTSGDIKAFMKSAKRELNPKERERCKALYDAEIKYSDDQLGGFFTMLDDLGLYENSVIILLSDHGEQFWEHGIWGHNCPSGMYEDVLRVPIIIKHPKGSVKGVNHDRLARLIDITPTIVSDILGMDWKKWEFEGVPLSEPIGDSLSVGESCMSYNGIDLFGFRDNNHKYILNKKKNPPLLEVFDMKNDPKEMNNLAKDYKTELNNLYAFTAEAEHTYLTKMKEMNHPVKLDDDTIKMLKDLGYVD